ncbi:peptidoglycan-binding domain-containing protein [Streptomyces sp. NPDC001728]|uniref:peptidoglycan-binding domain-containing protein n=1 Tax=Streptomyces sp. NPDC001728 TaxID=3154396 RepID=UPI0033234A3A
MFSRPVFKRAALLTSSVALAVVSLAGTASAVPSAPYVAYGDQGDGVRCVQAAVVWSHTSSARLEEDGIWGDRTQAGVLDFQRAKLGSSQADGVVGPNTGDKMLAVLGQNPAMYEFCYDVLPSHY